MWITSDVNLPEEVLRAHAEHRLVIFAGAGVSAASPSNLPMFDALADTIGAEVALSRGDVSPDVFLGRAAATTGADVHARVHDLISSPTSKPNRLHRTLAQLALRGLEPRLVTTNYDRHLSRCITRVRPKIAEFQAPALPLGDNFTGLVYLHGTLTQDPGQLIVTDADFGRAYLAQAWATRFLHGMFSTYVVLFVGYSHRDTIMTYLARGLPAGAERYVLTEQPDAADWPVLNVIPIGYDNPGGDHRSLLRALQRWVALNEMGHLDHQQRIRQLAGAIPSGDFVDLDYMTRMLADASTARMFADEVGTEWLDWATQLPTVKIALATSIATPAQRAVCDWFGGLIANGASRHGLRSLQQLGIGPGAPAWFAIVGGLRQLAKTAPADVRPWLPLLLGHVPPSGARELTWLIQQAPGLTGADVVLLLDRILAPRVMLQPGFLDPEDGSPPRVRQEIAFDFDEYWIRDAWDKRVMPRLAEIADALLPVLEAHLRRCHAMHVQAGQAERRFDPESFRRSAIEPHSQDTSREPSHVLVDLARDLVEHLLDHSTDHASAMLNSWARSDPPLLRRLAIHGWRIRPGATANDKLRWLLRAGVLYDTACKHEIFLLLQQTLPDVSLSLARELVRTSVAEQPHSDQADYELFNLMGWLVGARPDLTAAQKVLHKVRAQHPEYSPRPHPDLNWHMMTGWSGSSPPMSTDAFTNLLTADPPAALAEILQHTDADPFGGGISWGDALSMITSATAQMAQHGVTLLNVADSVTEKQRLDLWRAVLNGWARGTLDKEAWAVVLPALTACPLLAQLLHYVAGVLEHGTSHGSGSPDTEQLAELQELARQLWRYDTGVPDGVEEETRREDWLGFALNAWGGMLAQFWVNGLILTQGGKPPQGLDDRTAAAFDAMLASTTEQGGAARAILGSRLVLLFQLDQPWTVARLLPEFRWTDGADLRAAQVWSGHLYWGGWHDGLLSAGLLQAYLDAQDPVAAIESDELRGRYYGHLAGIALTSSIHPLETPNGWLSTFVVKASPQARVDWAVAVREVLNQLTPEARALAWTSWIHHYWEQRLRSRPLPLTNIEHGVMAGWLPYLGEHLPAAAALLLRAPASLPPDGNWWFDLEEVVEAYPAQIAGVVTHLLGGSDESIHDAYQLGQLVERLKPLLPADALRPLVEAALSRNIAGAAGWLT